MKRPGTAACSERVWGTFTARLVANVGCALTVSVEPAESACPQEVRQRSF
jgi:hypothetical protein